MNQSEVGTGNPPNSITFMLYFFFFFFSCYDSKFELTLRRVSGSVFKHVKRSPKSWKMGSKMKESKGSCLMQVVLFSFDLTESLLIPRFFPHTDLLLLFFLLHPLFLPPPVSLTHFAKVLSKNLQMFGFRGSLLLQVSLIQFKERLWFPFLLKDFSNYNSPSSHDHLQSRFALQFFGRCCFMFFWWKTFNFTKHSSKIIPIHWFKYIACVMLSHRLSTSYFIIASLIGKFHFLRH